MEVSKNKCCSTNPKSRTAKMFMKSLTILLLCVGAYGKHPTESRAQCRSRINSQRIVMKDDPLDNAKGRLMQKSGGLFLAGGHRLLLAEYCALCTMATPEQANEGYLKSGCRFQLKNLGISTSMQCVVRIFFRSLS